MRSSEYLAVLSRANFSHAKRFLQLAAVLFIEVMRPLHPALQQNNSAGSLQELAVVRYSRLRRSGKILLPSVKNLGPDFLART